MKRAITEFTFSIPEHDQYGENYTMVQSEKHALESYYAHDSRPQTEIRFETMLDKSDKIDWWWKNGEKMQHYFGIAFIAENEGTGVKSPATFYPDYIIRYTDGSIGIYDTKAGSTVTSGDTKLKPDALQQYLTENKELRVAGGIVDARQDGSFWLQDDTSYNAEDSSKWKPFIL